VPTAHNPGIASLASTGASVSVTFSTTEGHPVNVEQKKICVISTTHLKPSTREEWMEQPPESLHVAPFQHGFFVYVKATDDLDEDDPIEVRELAKWLDDNFAEERWVMFDCDASTVEGLTVYDDEGEEVEE
jgi:hypothetical protein